MSFGWSAGDLLLLINILRTTIDRVRQAPKQFHIFTTDLERTTSLFELLNRNFPDYLSTTNGLSVADHGTLDALLTDIRDGLQDLGKELDGSNVGGTWRQVFANLSFTSSLPELRDRLNFQMGALRLLMQILSLTRQRAQEEVLRFIQMTVLSIQQAQREQQEVDNSSNHNNPVEVQGENHGTMMSDYGSRSAARSEFGGTSARKAFIEWWRRNADQPVDGNLSPNVLFSLSLAQSVSSFQDVEAQPVYQKLLVDSTIPRPENSDGQTSMRYRDHLVVYFLLLAIFLSSIVLSVIQHTEFNDGNSYDEYGNYDPGDDDSGYCDPGDCDPGSSTNMFVSASGSLINISLVSLQGILLVLRFILRRKFIRLRLIFEALLLVTNSVVVPILFAANIIGTDDPEGYILEWVYSSLNIFTLFLMLQFPLAMEWPISPLYWILVHPQKFFKCTRDRKHICVRA